MPKLYDHAGLGYSQQAAVDGLPPGSKVLEVGCGTGYVTKVLKEDLNCRVTVVEIDESQAGQASRWADSTIVGDIEDEATWEKIGSGYDVVMFGDVLEHLRDPWEILRRTGNVLADGGRVIASIPNVAYYEVRLALLRGRFDYTDYGILDNTHLRFFTAASARRLFEDTGYRICRFQPIFKRARHRLLARVFRNACAFQFVIEAVPESHPEATE